VNKLLITNARLINEGETRDADVLIEGERISRIGSSISATGDVEVIDAGGRLLMPGMIDDQVHFREPGLTNKGDLATESAAAAAGGITSFMDMPNVNPQTTTRQALADKYAMAEHRCTANSAALERIFEHAPTMVVTHCEHSPTIWDNEAKARAEYGDSVPMSEHPAIRSAAACLKSSSMAVELARRFDALLHVLHLTTAVEMALFSKAHRSDKRITAEVCVHHLWFDESRYEDLGTRIKCNPAIKAASDRTALVKALNEGRIDVIATDHAPHTTSEKKQSYFKAPAGLPLVQHALQVLFDLAARGEISQELIVDRACHAPADLFGVRERGYVREGWYADLVIVDLDSPFRVEKSNLLCKCHWSPFEGHEFSSTIDTTIVNGEVVYRDGELTKNIAGQRLEFTRAR
jgi:dihydroorotase